MTVRWEYKIVTYREDDEAVLQLNKLGLIGWEMVAAYRNTWVKRANGYTEGSTTYILKRRWVPS